MQQAYRVLRVVSEAQTIRIVLLLTPDALMLRELCKACSALNAESSSGIKAVVLDFETNAQDAQTAAVSRDEVQQACAAVHRIEAPVLALVRGTLSPVASELVQAADFTLVAHDAVLTLHDSGSYDGHKDSGGESPTVGTLSPTRDAVGHEGRTYTGVQALRLRLVTWSVPASDIDAERERILALLREKSAAALRYTKASVRLAAAQASGVQLSHAAARLEALKQVNEFYLTSVMQTVDASEGLHSFLEKRKPQWKNR